MCICVWPLFELFKVCDFLMGLYQKKDSFFLGWFVQAVFKKKENIWILRMVSCLIVESVCVNG